MDIQREFEYLIKMCEEKLVKGEAINYYCPYCGMSLSGLFKKEQIINDQEEKDFEDESILCPCCGQEGAF